MATFIDPAKLDTPLYSDVYAFLTQADLSDVQVVRVFEMTIDRCPASFTAVNWASKNKLYRGVTVTPGRRFLIEVTPAGEQFITEYDYLSNRYQRARRTV